MHVTVYVFSMYVQYVCLSVCLPVCMYVCVCVCMCVRAYVPTCLYSYVFMFICLYDMCICVRIILMSMYRRKFRGQTSEHRGGKSQRREEKKKEDQRRHGVRRKKMQVREKVAMSRNIASFPMICGPGGSKGRCGAIWADEK